MAIQSHLGTVAAELVEALRLAAAAALVRSESELAAALDVPVAVFGIVVVVAAETEQHVDRAFAIVLCAGFHFGLASKATVAAVTVVLALVVGPSANLVAHSQFGMNRCLPQLQQDPKSQPSPEVPQSSGQTDVGFATERLVGAAAAALKQTCSERMQAEVAATFLVAGATMCWSHLHLGEEALLPPFCTLNW